MKRRKPTRLAVSWAAQTKDLAQICVSLITIMGIPVGAYVFLLNAIGDVRREISGVRQESRDFMYQIERKMHDGFSRLDTDMRVLIERQYHNEKQVDILRGETSTKQSDTQTQQEDLPKNQ